jgi:hypothetical protein
MGIGIKLRKGQASVRTFHPSEVTARFSYVDSPYTWHWAHGQSVLRFPLEVRDAATQS